VLPNRLTLRTGLDVIDVMHLLAAKVMKKLLILFLRDISSGHPEGILTTELR
jgi:hypothetical protein